MEKANRQGNYLLILIMEEVTLDLVGIDFSASVIEIDVPDIRIIDPEGRDRS